MSGSSPPARGQKLGTLLGLNEFEVYQNGGYIVNIRNLVGSMILLDLRLTSRVPATPEAILLPVAGSEDVIPRSLRSQNSSDVQRRQTDRVEGEISSLKRVGKGYPGEITDSEHEAESVGCDVHRGQDRCLEIPLMSIWGRLANDDTSSLTSL